MTVRRHLRHFGEKVFCLGCGALRRSICGRLKKVKKRAVVFVAQIRRYPVNLRGFDALGGVLGEKVFCLGCFSVWSSICGGVGFDKTRCSLFLG